MRLLDAATIVILLGNVIVRGVPDVKHAIVVEDALARHLVLIVHIAIHGAQIVLEIVVQLAGNFE